MRNNDSKFLNINNEVQNASATFSRIVHHIAKIKLLVIIIIIIIIINVAFAN